MRVGRKRLFTDNQETEICDLYFKNKLSQRKIAKQRGCRQGTICNIIKERGYKARNHSECQRGRLNSCWKGGRHVNTYGYVMVYNPSHPHCSLSGYMKEHRLVMEKHLGRYLEPEEVVHHHNKNKTDNRIENLFLFENGGIHTKWHKCQKGNLSYEQK